MSPWRPHLLILLVLALVAVPSASVAAEDGGSEASGFVFVQIDGLSEPVLRTALESGAMPFLSSLIDDGTHTLEGWGTTAASTTTVMQAGLLHGRWRDIPGFRWWDRETGQLLDFLDREQARLFEQRIDGPADLLAEGGASITNLFAGGAPRVVLTAAHFDGAALPWEVVRYLADVPKVLHVVAGFGDGVVAAVGRMFRGEDAPISAAIKRKAPVPIVGPALEWALVEVTAAAMVRELQQDTPLMYATFTTFDEVGHYAGPDHPAAMDALSHIDESLSFVAAAAEQAPRRYRLVVLSDHGQTAGEPFELRYGETLTEVVRPLLSAAASDSRPAVPPDLVVAESGNLAHVYLPALGERLDATEIEARHPRLLAGLVAHRGVGVVVVQTADGGLLALGRRGSHELTSGHIEGHDPVGHYGPLAAESLLNIASSPNAGDLVVISIYDPVADEVASFEPQISSHGGIGGPQMQPFLLYPSELEGDSDLLSLEGVDALRAKLDEWLEADAVTATDAPTRPAEMSAQDSRPSPEASSTAPTSPPPAAHIGAPVCVSARVTGALGKACARRDRFGARWTLQATDTQADDRTVKATIRLEVFDARDETATLEHDLGVGDTASTNGSFSPRIGSALGDISITTCVVERFRPDRCETTSATLPQLAGRASPAQSARLESLVFDEPLESFMAIWEQEEHRGIDADFDWDSNGCSAGRLAGLFDERLGPACIRHDFAYRNYGHLLYVPTDSMHRRVNEQLAADAIALGYADLAPGLRQTLQRFGAPAFFGRDMATAWSVPTFLVPFLSTDETGDSPN